MSITLTRTDLIRAVGRYRLLLSAGLAAGSVATALGVLAPSVPPGVLVLRAAKDLSAGTALTGQDLVRTPMPAGLVPAGALLSESHVQGRLLAGPVRAGEPLTDVRLAGTALLGPSHGGLRAVPVRLADAASAALLQAGDRVDVLAASSGPDGPPSAQVVAPDAVVLAVPTAVQDGGEGALVVLAATPIVAARLAAAAVAGRLSVVLRGAP